MLLIILGAGASYDSSVDLPPQPTLPPDDFDHGRLPLAKTLFARRGLFSPAIAQYPECAPVLPRLRRPPHDNTVERELELLRDESAVDTQRRSQLLAIRYYLREIISTCETTWLQETHSVTNYGTLVDQLRTWQSTSNIPVRIVTFNYDTLLEDAWNKAGLRTLTTIDDYVAGTEFRLFKLHGSTSWFRPTGISFKNDMGPYKYYVSLREHLQPQAEYTHKLSNGKEYLKSAAVVPAIALPFEVKKEFECPSLHVDQLMSEIQHVRKVLVVGWRASEQAFVRLWADKGWNKATIHIVSASRQEAEAIAASLGSANVKGEIKSSERTGFSNFLQKDELQAFLES